MGWEVTPARGCAAHWGKSQGAAPWTFYLGHTEPLHTPCAPRLTFYGCSFSLLQPQCFGWLHMVLARPHAGPCSEVFAQESSQRWQIKVVYVAMIPQSNQEHSYTLLSLQKFLHLPTWPWRVAKPSSPSVPMAVSTEHSSLCCPHWEHREAILDVRTQKLCSGFTAVISWDVWFQRWGSLAPTVQIPKAPRWSCRVLSTRWDISCQHIILQEFSNPSPGINHSSANAATSRLPRALLRQCFVMEQPSFKPTFPEWKSCKQCWSHMHEHLQLFLFTATAKLPPWSQGEEQIKSTAYGGVARDNASPTLVALRTLASQQNPLHGLPPCPSRCLTNRVPKQFKMLLEAKHCLTIILQQKVTQTKTNAFHLLLFNF